MPSKLFQCSPTALNEWHLSLLRFHTYLLNWLPISLFLYHRQHLKKKTTDFHSTKLGLKSSCTNYRQNILGQNKGDSGVEQSVFFSFLPMQKVWKLPIQDVEEQYARSPFQAKYSNISTVRDERDGGCHELPTSSKCAHCHFYILTPFQCQFLTSLLPQLVSKSFDLQLLYSFKFVFNACF